MPLLLLKDLPRYECLLEGAKEFPELDPSACEAFLHLLRTGDEVFSVAEKNFAKHAISQGRFGVLMLLWNPGQRRGGAGADPGCPSGGPRTPAELAEAAGVTRATMTGLIDTLERDGFVRREPDLNDRRMMSVRLTSKAENFLRGMLPAHFRMMAMLMAPLSEAERKTLVRLLTKVLRSASELTSPEAGSGANGHRTA